MKMHLDGSTNEIISKTMKGNWGLAGRISQLLQIAKLLSKPCWKLMAEDYAADVIGDGPVFTETMLYCNNFKCLDDELREYVMQDLLENTKNEQRTYEDVIHTRGTKVHTQRHTHERILHGRVSS